VLDAQTRLVPVIASIDNTAGQWRVGEGVQASLQWPNMQGRQMVVIPQTAVQTIEGKTVVFVRSATGFKVVPVTLGANSGNQVVILTGLTGTEQIAATNSFTLKAELGKSAAGEEE
jgi:cobalt-zinc-cadmium efflux system membrane fusion protein